MRRLILLTFALATILADAAPMAGSVIYVSRKLRMSSAEANPAKDYYLDMGSYHGVREGDVFQIYRTTAVLNGVSGLASNVIRIPLGELTVYLAGEYTSVARLTALPDPKKTPMMDIPVVMIGDEVIQKTSLPFPQ